MTVHRPSYEKFNYAIRPNKRTQRKMIFEALGRYVGAFPGQDFRYVGFGSMWFSDFIIAHRKLGIKRLTSIEMPDGYKRAQYNRPFSCIRVMEGISTAVLPKLNWKKPAIVWLDYDYAPESESLQDLAFLGERAQTSSVLMATFDARPPWRDGDSRAARGDALRRTFGDSVPTRLPRVLAPEEYPDLLVKILWAYLESTLSDNGRAREGVEIVPLFSFWYKDGAPMITIGGALLDRAGRKTVKSARLLEGLSFLTGKKLFNIAIPPITPKERSELDRRLPRASVNLPFPLPREFVEAYAQLYRYYPMMGEVDL
ncbi:MAG: hypothetical protein KBG48_04095 [Kofleriaceae bacterium]|nr:hypothetical protein [Kofleriaceae bacterium]MBP9166539.1 hypothetical protein [Kofleriaceae bacterium]